jgi:hypothetical protein
VNDLVGLVKAALISGALNFEAAEAAAATVLREVAAAVLAVQSVTNYVSTNCLLLISPGRRWFSLSLVLVCCCYIPQSHTSSPPSGIPPASPCLVLVCLHCPGRPDPAPPLQVTGMAARMMLACISLELFVEAAEFVQQASLRQPSLAALEHDGKGWQ